MPRRMSDAEARRPREKHEYIRGQKVIVTKEAERLHDEIHGRIATKATAKKTTAKKATAKMATAKKATAKKATARRQAPPPRRSSE